MTPDRSAAPWVPDRPTVTGLRSAAAGCRGCELWEDATQVVFSSGPARARLVLVGEQPGDQEDRAGEPFVGPAGRLLDRALERAGVPRDGVYLTNAVKHFRHRASGKRRLHQKPDVRHVVACGPWLEAELDAVGPEVVVALGATAARAVLGRAVKVGAERGRLVEEEGRPRTVVTTHPSALLRVRDSAEREAGLAELASDLALAWKTCGA
jgi:uracil-DNA glycosylase family protein